MIARSSKFPVLRIPRRRVRIVLALLTIPLFVAKPRVDAAPAQTVKLAIDYGDGAQLHFPALSWREAMTALDVLLLAQKHPHGVKFRHRGTGAHAKVEQIGDLTNQGDGKNWIYSVNGKRGEVSAGVQTLKNGDTVLWKFQEYE